jgi:hypothetical protein
MKKILLASACILALSSTGAIAQTNQAAPGASTQGNVGPDSSRANMHKGTTTGSATTRDKRGDSKGMTPSGAGPNTNNMGSQAGGGSGGAGGAK